MSTARVIRDLGLHTARKPVLANFASDSGLWISGNPMDFSGKVRTLPVGQKVDRGSDIKGKWINFDR
jgi:hypothetical protein